MPARLGSIEDLFAPHLVFSQRSPILVVGFVFLPPSLLVSPAAPNSNALFRAVAFIVGFAAVMIAYHTILEGVAGTTLGWWLTEKRSCERIAPKWDYGARHSEIACA
jgi:hypothetical protein